MIKKRTLIALSIVSLLTLAGCGNTGVEPDDNSSVAQTESEKTKENITVGAVYEYDGSSKIHTNSGSVFLKYTF